ncbi:hypothetical protein GDO78_020983 [Eleutherodactylus coqui]|uniref:Uncharacterized protein n=1 Tax=Eleutherodactylus coqui TaxID=57060 RepID=A0A8J6BJA8_ELECQ|nr:hypothetical protein GDO78_020983 [Eleutherodactylus coqui]
MTIPSTSSPRLRLSFVPVKPHPLVPLEDGSDESEPPPPSVVLSSICFLKSLFSFCVLLLKVTVPLRHSVDPSPTPYSPLLCTPIIPWSYPVYFG